MSFFVTQICNEEVGLHCASIFMSIKKKKKTKEKRERTKIKRKTASIKDILLPITKEGNAQGSVREQPRGTASPKFCPYIYRVYTKERGKKGSDEKKKWMRHQERSWCARKWSHKLPPSFSLFLLELVDIYIQTEKPSAGFPLLYVCDQGNCLSLNMSSYR